MSGRIPSRLAAPRLHQLATLSLLAAVQAGYAQTSPEATIAASVTGSVSQVDTRRSNGVDQSGLVLQVRPGLVLNSRTGRIRGSLSYFADLRHDSDSSRSFDVTNNLDARFTAEAVENFAFLDVTAAISNRALAAFGTRAAPTGTREEANRGEVSSLTLRPYVRGVLGGIASYNAALYSSATRSSGSQVGDVNASGASLAVASLGGGLFGWGVDGSHQRTEFQAGRATVDDRVFGSLNLRPDVDWNFSLRAGTESTDVGSPDRRSYSNWGAGLRWTPSPRTVLSADLDERYFGRSWQVLLEHRFALSTLRLSSTRAASSDSYRGADNNAITAYQLLFAQFATLQPNPVLRDVFVRDTLRSLGIDPNARLAGGTLGNAMSLQRRTDIGWTYTGARLALALQAFTAATRVIDTQTPQLGDGALGQRGLLATVSWRLSPTAGLNVNLSHLRTAGSALNPGSHLNSVGVGATEQLGQYTSASVNARLSAQSGGADPYRERAIGASISYRF